MRNSGDAHGNIQTFHALWKGVRTNMLQHESARLGGKTQLLFATKRTDEACLVFVNNVEEISVLFEKSMTSTVYVTPVNKGSKSAVFVTESDGVITHEVLCIL